MTLPVQRAFEILLVEDNENDAFFIKRAFAASEILVNLHIVTNGDDALAFLSRKGKYDTAPVPNLIVLDLHLPGMDGQDLLIYIKSHAQFSDLKIVALSGLKLVSD